MIELHHELDLDRCELRDGIGIANATEGQHEEEGQDFDLMTSRLLQTFIGKVPNLNQRLENK
jgi:hypothetical protein